MILWFSGISGVGKTTIAKKTYKILKKNNKNFIWIDGDEFRKIFKNDLKYTLKDRNKNAERICSFVKFISEQNINIILSANLTSNKYRIWCKNNLKDYLNIYIRSNLKILKMRDKKNIYNQNQRLNNVVGFGIKNVKPIKVDYFIENNSSKKKFLDEIKKIIKILKSEKIKIY